VITFRFRGVVETGNSDISGDIDATSTSSVRFSHDPRLQLSNFVYHTPEQVNIQT